MATKKNAAPKAPAQPKATAPAKNVAKNSPLGTAAIVGGTCQYTPTETDQEVIGTSPCAAIITEVKADGIVNLQVFMNSPYGPFFRSNVPAGSGPHTWA